MEAQEFISELVDHGMTQDAIALRTGIPQSSISKVLRGTVNDVLSKNYRALQALHAEIVKPRPAKAKRRRVATA